MFHVNPDFYTFDLFNTLECYKHKFFCQTLCYIFVCFLGSITTTIQNIKNNFTIFLLTQNNILKNTVKVSLKY